MAVIDTLEETEKKPTLKTQTRTVAGRTVIFDPRRRGGSALLPTDPGQRQKRALDAATLDESAAIINADQKARVKTAAAVPVDSVEQPKPAEVPKPVIVTPEEDIAEIQTRRDAAIAEIRSQPTVLASQVQEIAQITAQAKQETDAIKAEQKLETAEKARLGKEFDAKVLKEKIDLANDLLDTGGVASPTRAQVLATELLDFPDSQRDEVLARVTSGEAGNIEASIAMTKRENAISSGVPLGLSEAKRSFNELLKDAKIEPDSEYSEAFRLGGTIEAADDIMASAGRSASVIRNNKIEFLDARGKDGASIVGTQDKATRQSDFLRGGLSISDMSDFSLDLETTPSTALNVYDSALNSGLLSDDQAAYVRARKTILELSAKEKKRKETGDAFADASPEQIAENIYEGVGDVDDILTKNRQPVLVELRKRQKESLARGDMEGVLKASAVHGNKVPSDTFLGSFAKGMNVIDQVGQLQRLMFTDGYVDENTGEKIDLGPLSGWLAENNPWDAKAQRIKAILQQTIPNLARGVFGEVGVLTDRDVELYRKTLPNLKSTKLVQQAVLGITLRAVQRSLENQIRTQADGRRNMSGFVDQYNAMVAKTDKMMGIRDLSQVSVDIFEQLSEDDKQTFIEESKSQFYDVSELRQSLGVTTQESMQENTNAIKSVKEEPEFQARLEEVSTNIGIQSEDLLAVIGVETAGTFDPSIKNPLGSASGIIQFTEATAKGLGTTTEKIRNMTGTEQLDLVETFLTRNKGKIKNRGDLYMAIFQPAALGESDDFVIGSKGGEKNAKKIAKLNPAISQGKEVITVADVRNFINNA